MFSEFPDTHLISTKTQRISNYLFQFLPTNLLFEMETEKRWQKRWAHTKLEINYLLLVQLQEVSYETY